MFKLCFTLSNVLSVKLNLAWHFGACSENQKKCP